MKNCLVGLRTSEFDGSSTRSMDSEIYSDEEYTEEGYLKDGFVVDDNDELKEEEYLSYDSDKIELKLFKEFICNI